MLSLLPGIFFLFLSLTNFRSDLCPHTCQALRNRLRPSAPRRASPVTLHLPPGCPTLTACGTTAVCRPPVSPASVLVMAASPEPRAPLA